MAAVTIKTTYYTPGMLTVDPLSCGSCGVVFGMEHSMWVNRRETGRDFWCPNGCRISYSESDNKRLTRELKSERDNAARLVAERDQIEASRRAYKASAARARNRALEGNCPMCGKHVYQLERHVKRVHSDEQSDVTIANNDTQP